ncbi:unnamed protein product [Cuscuta epithymum]|uniref:Uncharacterized protein n=1 Tax=Cuscuta epithymum TaxID=186058 RepID=A0AAV0BZS9_9ASTE|nr:unnamed protein product [Cuscuta epithymum]
MFGDIAGENPAGVVPDAHQRHKCADALFRVPEGRPDLSEVVDRRQRPSDAAYRGHQDDQHVDAEKGLEYSEVLPCFRRPERRPPARCLLFFRYTDTRYAADERRVWVLVRTLSRRWVFHSRDCRHILGIPNSNFLLDDNSEGQKEENNNRGGAKAIFNSSEIEILLEYDNDHQKSG